MVAHPDEEMSEQIRHELQVTYAQKGIGLTPQRIDFDKIDQSFNQTDQVYITLDAKRNPEAYKMLMDLWCSRQRQGRKIIDLMNDPDKYVGVAQAKLAGIMGCRDIGEEIRKREKFNARVQKQLEVAAAICADVP